MYYVYLLRSEKDGTFYTGFSENLARRLKEHNRQLATYTSTKAPVKLVWYSCFENKEKALDFERYLKSSSGFAFRNKHSA
ncbi:MAG TPA: GIY-YIG nuclease family protein [Candidatus Paceibacterota bacterium]|nr:GIY-YIG nuclease family protein [Candidatus Paceibacterota bacterium]